MNKKQQIQMFHLFKRCPEQQNKFHSAKSIAQAKGVILIGTVVFYSEYNE